MLKMKKEKRKKNKTKEVVNKEKKGQIDFQIVIFPLRAQT